MRALANRLILKADLDQKATLKYGTLTLFMPPNLDKLTTDGKVGNPVMAQVVGAAESYPHIQEGDMLLLNHNIIGNKAFQTIESEGSVIMLVIPIDKGILGKLGADGNVNPLCENVLCERIMEPERSSIIATPDAFKKTEENKLMVIAVSPEASNSIIPGYTAVVHKYSDYECNFTINGERRTAIIVWMMDIVGMIGKVWNQEKQLWTD